MSSPSGDQQTTSEVFKLAQGPIPLISISCFIEFSNNKISKSGIAQNEVRVEKIDNAAWQSYVVRVTCERTGGRLVSILEAFEKLGLNVMQARICCNRVFVMEAIAVAAVEAQPLEARDVSRALLQAIEQHNEEGSN